MSDTFKLPTNGTIWNTFILGLAFLIAIVFLFKKGYLWKATIPRDFEHYSKPTSTSNPNMDAITGIKQEQNALKEAIRDKGIDSVPYANRLDKPNFGYGNIKVAKLLVHPIKSCRGTSVQSCRYTPEGVENDRKWAIIDEEKHHIITAREISKMILITPKVEVDENSPYDGLLRISFPEGSGCDEFVVPLRPTEDILKTWRLIDDIQMWDTPLDGYICETPPSMPSTSGRSPSTILSEYLEKPVHLVFKGGRPRPCETTSLFPELKMTAVYQDCYPLLVLSEENVKAVEEELRGHVGTLGIEERWAIDNIVVERFRPNIVLQGAGPFEEDNWEEIGIGRDESLASSNPGILLVSKCARCLLPNVSPETGIRDKAVPFKVLMKFRVGVDPENKWKPCVGCNGVPLAEGVISVGDTVVVRKMIV